MWGVEIIVNVNCLSDATMTFQNLKGTVSIRVKMPRLSATVMSRDSRYNYTHQIDNGDFDGDRRVSLNFRQMKI